MRLAQTGRVAWACSQCIAERKAIRADPALQVYCCDVPYFAYRDTECTCRDCGGTFVFGAAEQKFWYEERRFLLASWPVRCAPCRRARRRVKRGNEELAAAVHALDENDPDSLAALAEKYLELGLQAKAEAYLRRAKNKCRRKDAYERLVKRLEDVTKTPARTVIDVRVGGRNMRFRER